MLGINFEQPGANFGEHTAAEKPKVFVSLCKSLQGKREAGEALLGASKKKKNTSQRRRELTCTE